MYFLNRTQTAISLALAKTQREYILDYLFPFFSNMLSDRANKAIQCRNLKIDKNDDFGLLLATAHTNTIGAITVERVL